jgi:two-component system chemotaxis sensor kinase CheA
MGDLEDAIREFLIEANEGLDQLDRDLVELEKNPDSMDLLKRIFRTAHTIKGTGGVFGFNRLSAVAHVGESLLSRMRDRKLRLDSRITSVLLAMLDALRDMLKKIEATGSEGEGDYSPVVLAINAILNAPVEAVAEACVAHSVAAGAPVAEEPKRTQAIEPPPAMKAEAGSSGVHAGGALPYGASETSATAADLPPQPAGITLAGDPKQESGVTAEAQASLHKDAVEKPAENSIAESGAHEKVEGNTIRVDVRVLDKVMDLVGELVLARNQILQSTVTAKDAALLSTAQRLNLITTELQEGIMKTRMQPVENVWNKLPRLARDLAMHHGKEVSLEMEGADTELDKTVIEAIHEPLLQIVRNAVAHGIEDPAARSRAGKNAAGRLTLRASHEGGQVNIDVCDDGAGIDAAALKQAALERRAITPEQAARMTDREAVQLVFMAPAGGTKRPGSMAQVKSSIEALGGMVEIHSVAGQGTTIRLKIPLTLAIIPALIVRCGRQRFAIPQVSLLELVRVEPEQVDTAIEVIDGAAVYRLRGNLLPLVDLGQVLQLVPRAVAAVRQAVSIAVLQVDDRSFGLIVEEVNDTEEIVVKPLGRQLKHISCYAGATILGDGQVALILDVLNLAQMVNLAVDGRAEAIAEESRHGEAAAAGESWLVFAAGKDARMAIPLARVSRIENISAQKLERSGDAEVVQYRGRIMPLIRVASQPGVSAPVASETMLPVIVCSREGQNVGLIVKRIIDIVEQAAVQEQPGSGNGRSGSAIIQQCVTDIVDVDALAAQAGFSGRAGATASM